MSGRSAGSSMVRDIVTASLVDLLILDVDTPDGDAVALVSEIRNSRVGRNPFLPIIFVTRIPIRRR